MFADRTSCHYWWANQFRLLLASLGYLLLDAFRRLGLAGTDLARAQCSTLRVKFLEIGGVILRNTRHVRILLASHHPLRETLSRRRLHPGYLTRSECCPRHGDKPWGKGELRLLFRNQLVFAISPPRSHSVEPTILLLQPTKGS